MQSVIRLLPESLANQIAAGEVVQRPASAVKELMENAVDAGADRIELIIEDAGKRLIQVIDNGSGMSAADALMAFERHATSKITRPADLFRIQTMGFRGEALASIAAVAQVKMKTRPADSELATEVTIEGGRIISNQPVQAPKGTSIAVRNLFFNVPARRNFLKSGPVEFRHILTEWMHIALGYPEKGFSLVHNKETIFETAPQDLLSRIISVHKNIAPKYLKSVFYQSQDLIIKGYVGTPETASKQRGDQYFFVNRRFIKSPLLHTAVMKVMKNVLEADKFPFYLLEISVPPDTIDINIHPTKAEIKFTDDREIFSQVFYAVRDALILPGTVYFPVDENTARPNVSAGETIRQFLPNLNSERKEEDFDYSAFSRKEKKEYSGSELPSASERFRTQAEDFLAKNDFEKKDKESTFPWESPPEQTTKVELPVKTFFKHDAGFIFRLAVILPQRDGLLITDQKRLLAFFLRNKLLSAEVVRKQKLLFPVSGAAPPGTDLSDLTAAGFEWEIDPVNGNYTLKAYPALIPPTVSIADLWVKLLSDASLRDELPETIAELVPAFVQFSDLLPYLNEWAQAGYPFRTERETLAGFIPENELLNRLDYFSE